MGDVCKHWSEIHGNSSGNILVILHNAAIYTQYH